MKHDSHYREMERTATEPIVRMEAEACRDLPQRYHEIARRNLCNALALKHELRAGRKAGEAEGKELEKAANYRHRATEGRWM